MKVQELMTKEVAVCRPRSTLAEAARSMAEKDCGSLPVVSSDGASGDGPAKVVGVVTDRDICLTALLSGKRLDEIPVEAAMESEVVSCGPSDDVSDAERLMRERLVRRLPVVDEDGSIRGLLSLAHLARAAARGEADGLDEAELGRTLVALSAPGPRTRRAS